MVNAAELLSPLALCCPMAEIIDVPEPTANGRLINSTTFRKKARTALFPAMGSLRVSRRISQ